MEPIVCRRERAEIASVMLNRPEKRNALSIELLKQLCGQIRELESDQRCRVVIVTGAGPVFSAGLDLIEAAQLATAEQSAELVAETFVAMMESRLVFIAAVQGAALAGGAGLMAACDFAVAADNVRVGFPEVRRGLLPALVAAVLAGRLRDAELRELFLLAEPIDAPRALQFGLVQRVVPAAALHEHALNLANLILQGAPDAIGTTKTLIRGFTQSAGDLFARALALHKAARQSDEAAEGLAAFAQRRDPNWSV